MGMSITLIVRDEVLGAPEDAARHSELVLPAERLTVRELIRERVYQEVQDHNVRVARDGATTFRGLVAPNGAVPAPDGLQPATRSIDWRPQFERACQAFQAQQMLVLVGERQVTSLDEHVAVAPRTEVVFVKLVPLVGG
jgi:hypothetical protein